MKKYTKEQLNSMLVEEVRSIAKNEFKLALSSQGKRFTKPQLISKIMDICMVSDIVEELKEEDQQVFEPILNINNTSTIVSQARMFLQNSLHSYKITKNKKDMVNNIKYVFDTANELRSQVATGKLKGFKRSQANNAITLLRVISHSYTKKAGIQL